MDIGSNAPGTRPVNFVFCSGDAQPLKLDGTDRRFWIVDAAKAVPVAALEAAGGELDKAVQAYNDWLPRQLAAHGDDVLTSSQAWVSRREAVAAEGLPPEPHPSRSAPKCARCLHVLRDKVFAYCDHPSVPVRSSDGMVYVRVEAARSGRGAEGICGPEGRLFVALDQPVSGL